MREQLRKMTGKQQTMPDRASPPRQAPLPELLARELIGVCMATLKSHGLPGERLAALATEAALEQSDRITSATAVLADSQRLAELADEWVGNPVYRDATGRPAMLTIRTRRGRSFATLARQYFPDRTVEQVIALACESRVAERVGTDKLALLNSTVLFTGCALPILAYVIRSVRRLLLTAEFNRRANANALENWPDRTSYVSISDADFREFVKVFRPQISGLIESSNRWLSQRAHASGARRRSGRVAGLQAFLFRE